MTYPAILFSMLLATLYGAAFHLWRGGGLGRLILYLVLSWVGFWGGQYLGDRLGWAFLSAGKIQIGLASLGSLLALMGGHWLSQVKKEGQVK